ncbi:MAG: Eco57I restriction-modification methylase domain-containing protein, partial [Candidatus Caldarchaeum sp.]
PNLDINIVSIADSLEVATEVQSVMEKFHGDPGYGTFVEVLEDVKAKYLVEHDPVKKNALRKRIEEFQEDYLRRTRLVVDSGPPIEVFMPSLADIIVMNPPYVRQEKIPKSKKEHLVKNYMLDRTSDIYAYFMVRALRLLKPRGVAALITSDKWLEVGYGITLQRLLKPHIVAVYGQRMRSFEADINTVITIMKKDKLPDSHPIQFIYLERYGDKPVRNYKSVERGKLKPGKWYYLRAPRFFEEVLLPKLTHKLKDFAEIKRGFTTGANEFFYVKDITHLYEADYLANPRKFNEWGVNAKTAQELRKQGLIYIENEGGERFVIDGKDVKPVVRSPKQIRSYKIKDIPTLCIYTSNPGRFTQQYIKWGERKGFHKRPTFRGRRPWYKLSDLDLTRLFMVKYPFKRMCIILTADASLCDQELYAIYPKVELQKLWTYLNSTLFYLTLEIYGKRMGGGILGVIVDDINVIPVPDLNSMRLTLIENGSFLNRTVLPYYKEIEQLDRLVVDRAVLRALAFSGEMVDKLVEELHKAFIELVEDRLIKASIPLREEEQESGDIS